MSTSKQLVGSFSEPNVNFLYVCLIGNITPAVDCEAGQSGQSHQTIDNINEEVGTSKDDDALIEVQRSAAFHELIESCRNIEKLEKCPENIEEIDSNTMLESLHINENSDDENDNGNPKILSLTRTKWLTDSRDGSPDASEVNALTGAKVRRVSRNKQGGFYAEPLLIQSASDMSSTSEDLVAHYSTHKALSTVLALDKELNLFGLSNTCIHAGPKPAKRNKYSGSKAVFHQTAIVQSCFKTCCRRRSRTDLPASLKCGGCKSRCSCARCRSCTSCTSLCPRSCGPSSPACSTPCNIPCGAPCVVPCPLFWSPPCTPRPCPPEPCPPPGCCTPACSKDCPRFGLQVSVVRKPKFDPIYTEIEPKSSCVLQKPFAARSCHHVPCCIPPSNCFPYLMPCFWPARSGAPCSEPGRCFHNPPCPRGRTPRSRIHPQELCAIGKKCAGKDKNEKCQNYSCIGRNNEALAKTLAEYTRQDETIASRSPTKAQSLNQSPKKFQFM